MTSVASRWAWRLAFPAVAAAGLILGAGSAWWLTGREAVVGGRVDAGGWTTSTRIGAPAADPWTRALIARIGLMALNRDEAIYYFRDTDDDGRRLDERCAYRLTGVDLPARWWSVTLYAEDEFLARNDDDAHSLQGSALIAVAENEGQVWRADVGPERKGDEPWLSTRAAGRFKLTLRLYHPAALLRENPAALPAPAVERRSCRETGSA